MPTPNPVRKKWTLDELHSLPEDGNKYEVIRGELFVTPAPTVSHETILARLTRILDPFVAEHDLGFVFHPRAVIVVDEDSEIEPDLMVRRPIAAESGWKSLPMPTLVVEVTSDSTRRRDRVHKRTIYVEAAIPEYWIVDPADRTIRVVRPVSVDTVATDFISWHPVGADAPLVIAFGDVFGAGAVLGSE